MRKILIGLIAATAVAAPVAISAPANAVPTLTTHAPKTDLSFPSATSVKVLFNNNGSRIVSKATTIYNGSTAISHRHSASGSHPGTTGRRRSSATGRSFGAPRTTPVRVLPTIRKVTRWKTFAINAPAPAPDAAQLNDPCVTQAEWNAVSNGMLQSDVHANLVGPGVHERGTGTNERLNEWRPYTPCAGFVGTLEIWFDNYSNGPGMRADSKDHSFEW